MLSEIDLPCFLNRTIFRRMILITLGLHNFMVYSSSSSSFDTRERTRSDVGFFDLDSAFPFPLSANEDDFKLRVRLMAYKHLLFRMFGSNFECIPISGGFSGSSVVKITPFDSIGNREESVIVKLDSAQNIRVEVAHSIQAQRALGEIAARVLGEPIYICSDSDGMEYGGFKMELAGAVLQVPELASSSAASPMINTFKDLLVYESEDTELTGTSPLSLSSLTEQKLTFRMNVNDEDSSDSSSIEEFHSKSECARPYGTVSEIIKQLFGQDGSGTRSLRRFESLTQTTDIPGGEYLVSRFPDSIKSNATVEYVLESIAKRSKREHISPIIRINEALKRAKEALGKCPASWKLTLGFCHGDLNGSNIIIDAMEGMWLIDFATARRLPLATDVAKLETCILFEYAFVPFPITFLLDIADQVDPGLLAKWFRVEEHHVSELIDACKRVTAGPWTEERLERILMRLGRGEDNSWVRRRLRSRLTASEESFLYCVDLFEKAVAGSILPTRHFSESVRRIKILLKSQQPPSGSLLFALSVIEKVLSLSFADIEKLNPNSADPIEFASVLLREVARLVGYEDVSPWTKLVASSLGERLADIICDEVDRFMSGHGHSGEKGTCDSLEEQPSDDTPATVVDECFSVPDSLKDAIFCDSSSKSESIGDFNTESPLNKAQSDEARKYQRHIKAKYSFLTDFVSGQQLDVLTQCCPFRLIASVAGDTESASAIDQETNSLLIGGIPGSGKTCFLRRIACESLVLAPSGLLGTVPVYISVNEWVRVLVSAYQQRLCALEVYLNSVFRDEKANFLSFIKYALVTHNAVLLVDGLDDAGSAPELQSMIVKCLLKKSRSGIRTVVTHKTDSLSGELLEIFGETMRLAEIAPLDRDQRRHVVKSRLMKNPEGMMKFEAFFDSFEKSATGGALIRSPAFLSMLLCYWQSTHHHSESVSGDLVRQRSLVRSESLQIQSQSCDVQISRSVSPLSNPAPISGAAGHASVQDVYKVAVSVLVHRFQMTQETDRIKVRDCAKKTIDLLRLVAFRMKCARTGECSQEEIESFIESASNGAVELQNEWAKLSRQNGKFQLLGVVQSIPFTKYRFSLSGMQDYLAAEYLVHDPWINHVVELPPLPELVSDPWWLPCISMLADKAPMKYVKILERKLVDGAHLNNVPNKDTCLHIAARSGHLPLFQVLSKSPLLESLVARPNAYSLLPLHEAAKCTLSVSASITRLLIASKADVWATTIDGWCALHFAASCHNREVVAALLADSRRSASFSQLPQMPRQQLSRLSSAGLSLARRILDRSISASDFITSAKAVFPELSYFRGRSDTTPDASASVKLEPSEIEYRRTISAMLSVYYVVSDRYEEFVACQGPPEVRLSKASWNHIRDWTVTVVRLTTPESVDAMLCLMAIHDLGKLKDFRHDLAADYKDHDAAMKYIMSTTPEVLPSLCRLSDSDQFVVRATLALDFNFGQFLQAENLAANLVSISDLFAKRGEQSLAFYLFHIFADMGGIMGAIQLEGSAFMTETMYHNFRLGIEAISQLNALPVDEVYNNFLRKRSVDQGLEFRENNPQDRAVVRLSCLCRVFDKNGGAAVKKAFESLSVECKIGLTEYLTHSGAAFLLYYAPALMENASRNPHVGLESAMKLLFKIFKAAESEFSFRRHGKSVIVIHIAQAAEAAKICDSAESFDNLCFTICPSSGTRKLSEGTMRISPWQLKVSSRAIEELGIRVKNYWTCCSPLKDDDPHSHSYSLLYPELGFFNRNNCDIKSVSDAATWVKLACNDYEGWNRKCIEKNTFSDLVHFLKFLIESVSSQEDRIQNGNDIGEMEDIRDLVMVVVVCGKVIEIPQLGSDLQVNSLNEILLHFSQVLPSFHRLSVRGKATVSAVLSVPFVFGEFIHGERCTESDVIELFSILKSQTQLIVFLLASLAQMDGLSESSAPVFVKASKMVLKHFSSTSPESVVTEYLKIRGSAQNLLTNHDLIRFAILTRSYFPTGGQVVATAFSKLSSSEKSILVDRVINKSNKFLNLSLFLSVCKMNAQIGLEVGLSVLFKVVNLNLEAKHDVVDLGLLAKRAQRHSVSLPFRNIQVSLSNDRIASVQSEPLIPVYDPTLLEARHQAALGFTSQIIAGTLSETLFAEQLVNIYPELDSFSECSTIPGSAERLSPDATVAGIVGDVSASEIENRRTVAALLSVFLILTNNYESFVRNQSGSDRLSLVRWIELRDWILSILVSPEVIDVLFAMIVITGIGKIHSIGSPDWLGKTLATRPELLPSFNRLAAQHKEFIKECLFTGFNFGQFLQAENSPSSLRPLQKFIVSRGLNGLDLYLSFVFAQMAGLLGAKCQEGSVFMSEREWAKFFTGKEVLRALESEEPHVVYRRYLLRRVGQLLSDFRDTAAALTLARLCCLARVGSELDAAKIESGFDQMGPKDQLELVSHVTKGLWEGGGEGVTLTYLPSLMQNMMSNPSIQPSLYSVIVLKIFRAVESVNNGSVDCAELANWAREVQFFDSAAILNNLQIKLEESHRPYEPISFKLSIT